MDSRLHGNEKGWVMELIAFGNREDNTYRGFAPQNQSLSPAPPKSPFTPFRTRGQGDLLAVVASGSVKRHAEVNGSSVTWTTMHSEKRLFMYCPIREISVERRGTRVKKFNVFEDVSSELLNFTEERTSGTHGDFPGASFWYFLRKKVLRDFED
jgi:hypothetical protein